MLIVQRVIFSILTYYDAIKIDLGELVKTSLLVSIRADRQIKFLATRKRALLALCFCAGVVGALVLSPSRAACAGEAQPAAIEQVQARSYEIPAHLTEKERKWFITFQEGNFLSQGWQSISAEIMVKTPPEQQAEQKIALASLGLKIGTEWCRPNAVRRVNSSMLKEWGDILRKTAKKKPQQLASAIAYINQELNAVLD